MTDQEYHTSIINNLLGEQRILEYSLRNNILTGPSIRSEVKNRIWLLSVMIDTCIKHPDATKVYIPEDETEDDDDE